VADRAAALREATATLPTKGPADARVTIVEFSDFQCGYCRLAANTVETLLQRYPKDVRVVYAHFPLSNHPWATPAAVAATCAAEQSPAAFWTLHDTYFRDQSAFTVANVAARSRAALAGAQIDLDAWNACATDTASPAYQEALAAVQQQTAFGDQLGVTGTPGFFVNGRFVNGNQPIPVFVEAIDAALADAQ
jgi:protein-disulfide isomerase